MQPWYRQFWPWFLIVLPGVAVVATLYTVVLANRHADDLVIDDYYREGLAINRELARRQAAKSLGLTATLQVENRQLDIELQGSVTAAQLRLSLSHAMESDRDFVLPVRQVGSGSYRVTLPQPISGRWHWTLDEGITSTWRLDGDHFF